MDLYGYFGFGLMLKVQRYNSWCTHLRAAGRHVICHIIMWSHPILCTRTCTGKRFLHFHLQWPWPL